MIKRMKYVRTATIASVAIVLTLMVCGCRENSTNVARTTERAHTIKVVVTDTLSSKYPYGKQRKKRGGMWYTPVSGIWQTVWLESVPARYIQSLKIEPDLKGFTLRAECPPPKANPAGCATDAVDSVNTSETERITVTVCCGRTANASNAANSGNSATPANSSSTGNSAGETPPLRFDFAFSERDNMRIDLPDGQFAPWTPENPVLHKITVKFGDDEVESYFALRTVEIKEVSSASVR